MKIIQNMPMPLYLTHKAFSSGVIREMLDCPARAWTESYLNPDRIDPRSTPIDVGTVIHQVLLENGSMDNVVVVDPKDHPAQRTGSIPDGWTNKSIRDTRDRILAEGRKPILLPNFQMIKRSVESAEAFISSLRDTEPAVWAAFQPQGGQSETSIFWDDDGLACKARPDRSSTDYRVCVHVKTTQGSANPAKWGRAHLIGDRLYVAAAFYRRALLRTLGVESEHVFLVVEQLEPYLCSLVGVDPNMMAMGMAEAEAALRMVRQCHKDSKWPAYPARAVYPELPAWAVTEHASGSTFGDPDGEIIDVNALEQRLRAAA